MNLELKPQLTKAQNSGNHGHFCKGEYTRTSGSHYRSFKMGFYG